jgi:hypothetical protein
MGLTSSDLLEDLLVKCYKEGIIDEVRNQAHIELKSNKSLSQYEAYELSYKKIKKK